MLVVDMKCKHCGALMKEIKTEKIAQTKYHYLKCKKCKQEVARRDE